jgi:hypothetical protein
MATNKLGLKFSTIPFDFFNPIPINDSAHVYTNAIISDTVNWVKISGSFTADSAYNYFCIGNFFTDSLTSYIKLDSTAAIAYYYVDDVCISTDSNYCNSLTGLEIRNFKNPISVFPNPVANQLTVKTTNSVPITHLKIFTTSGQIIRNIEINSPTSEKIISNLDNLSSGIYFLKTETENATYYSKIIKL